MVEVSTDQMLQYTEQIIQTAQQNAVYYGRYLGSITI